MDSVGVRRIAVSKAFHRDIAIRGTSIGRNQGHLMNPTVNSKPASANPFFQGKSTYTFARLMRPSEVAEATQNQPENVKARVAGRWMLCGDVSPKMFSLLKNVSTPFFPTRATGFHSQTGRGYGVLTHQVNGHGLQSRFVLCLSDPNVREFLAATATEQVSFMLGNDNGNDALILESPLKSNELTPLLAMSQEASQQEQKVELLELPLVLEAVTSLTQVPSLYAGQTVHQANVSFLLPSILDENLRKSVRNAMSK